MNFLTLQRLLDALLSTERFATTGDLNGVFLPPVDPAAPVRRVGLALEPGPAWRTWVERERCDAVFLHRPWSMDEKTSRALGAAGVGVLAYHLAFDERLTTGFNPALAAACGWGEPVLLAEKQGRPLGMVCTLPEGPVPCAAIIARLAAEMGGAEETTPPAARPDTPVGRVACVGAMNDGLVRAADAAGAGLYVTGQWRQPARVAVRETGIGVVAVGHHRSEVWGLRTLARLLRMDPALGGVDVAVYSGSDL